MNVYWLETFYKSAGIEFVVVYLCAVSTELSFMTGVFDYVFQAFASSNTRKL